MTSKQLTLFDDGEWDDLVLASNKNKIDYNYGRLGILHHRLCQGLSFTGRFQMPVVKKVICEIPKQIIAYYRTKSGLFGDCTPHFYTNDNRIECLWAHPHKMLKSIRNRYSLVIGPDFSVYGELLLAQKLWNIFRNKLIVAWWQYWDLVAIPNISWIEGEYDLSFDGWPQNSVVAVNSTGVGHSKRCKAMWIEGYKEMVKRLNPIHIIRYGAKQKDEIESISTYYTNDNLKAARYGG